VGHLWPIITKTIFCRHYVCLQPLRRNRPAKQWNSVKLEIRSVERGIYPIGPQWTSCSYNYGGMHYACTKRPHFHFCFQIWGHIVFLDPDFPQDSKIRANGGINKGNITYFSLLMRGTAVFPWPSGLQSDLTSTSCSAIPIYPKTRKCRQFRHKYGLYWMFFIAHARNGHMSTSSLKSDVTIVFLDPNFLQDANISAIQP